MYLFIKLTCVSNIHNKHTIWLNKNHIISISRNACGSTIEYMGKIMNGNTKLITVDEDPEHILSIINNNPT